MGPCRLPLYQLGPRRRTPWPPVTLQPFSLTLWDPESESRINWRTYLGQFGLVTFVFPIVWYRMFNLLSYFPPSNISSYVKMKCLLSHVHSTWAWKVDKNLLKIFGKKCVGAYSTFPLVSFGMGPNHLTRHCIQYIIVWRARVEGSLVAPVAPCWPPLPPSPLTIHLAHRPPIKSAHFLPGCHHFIQKYTKTTFCRMMLENIFLIPECNKNY